MRKTEHILRMAIRSMTSANRKLHGVALVCVLLAGSTLGCKTTPSSSSLWSSRTRPQPHAEVTTTRSAIAVADSRTSGDSSLSKQMQTSPELKYASADSVASEEGSTSTETPIVSDAAFSALTAQPKIATHHPTNRYVQLKLQPTHSDSSSVVPTVATALDLGEVSTTQYDEELSFGTPPKAIPRTALRTTSTPMPAKLPETILVMPYAAQDETTSPSGLSTLPELNTDDSATPLPLDLVHEEENSSASLDATPAAPTATSSSAPTATPGPAPTATPQVQPVVTMPTCPHCHSHSSSTSCDEYVPY